MSTSPEDETYLRFQTVAKNLDVATSTVTRWVALGKIKAVTLGGVKGKRIARSEYVRFINETYGKQGTDGHARTG